MSGRTSINHRTSRCFPDFSTYFSLVLRPFPRLIFAPLPSAGAVQRRGRPASSFGFAIVMLFFPGVLPGYKKKKTIACALSVLIFPSVSSACLPRAESMSFREIDRATCRKRRLCSSWVNRRRERDGRHCTSSAVQPPDNRLHLRAPDNCLIQMF